MPQTPGNTGTLLPQREQPYASDTDETPAPAAPEPPLKQRPAEDTQPLRTEPGGLERDHNRSDAFRYDPLRPPAGYTGLTEATGQPPAPVLPPLPPRPPLPPLPTIPPAPPRSRPGAPVSEQQTTAASTPAQPPVAPDQPSLSSEQPEHEEPAPEPDVMVLPEPDDRNRPTVSLERSPVPEQGRTPTLEPLPRPTGDPATDARLEKLENSPFWLDNPNQAGARRLPEVSSHVGTRRRVRKGVIRKPAPALLALITLAMVASFFAWVSAEPFWLAVGHGDRGYATTTDCQGSGVAQRCAGRFEAADGSFAVTRIALLGVADHERSSGTVTPARMVSADSRMAYIGSTGLLVQLRWMLGFLLVLMCGYGIASLTGARRLEDPRARRLVTLTSVFAPLLILAGFLAAAY